MIMMCHKTIIVTINEPPPPTSPLSGHHPAPIDFYFGHKHTSDKKCDSSNNDL